MKKVIALVAAAAFVLSLATMASAAHEGRGNFGTNGYIQFSAGWVNNNNFEKSGGDSFTGEQRIRQFFSYTANENLKAVVGYDINSDWGSDNAAPGADATDQIELKRAMMEFTWPGTETTVKGGIQYIALPDVAMGGNPVMAGDMAGVTASTPISDMADLTIGWSRGYNSNADNAAPGLDTFFATLPVNQDGFSLAPFFAYSVIGKDVNEGPMSTGVAEYNSGFVSADGSQFNPGDDSASAYWAGTNFEMNQVDPIGVKASFIYGSLQADQDVNERAGWYADLSVDYEMPNVTPEFFAFYSSGEDDDETDGSEVMPWIYNDGLTSKAPSMLIGDMTTLGLSSPGVTLLQSNPVGLMSVGASLKHIQLMDRLSATLTAAYYQGTSDKEAGYNTVALTDEDSAWDITASTDYELYENLSAICEAGYAKKDMDDNSQDEPAYRFATGFRYSF